MILNFRLAVNSSVAAVLQRNVLTFSLIRSPSEGFVPVSSRPEPAGGRPDQSFTPMEARLLVSEAVLPQQETMTSRPRALSEGTPVLF